MFYWLLKQVKHAYKPVATHARHARTHTRAHTHTNTHTPIRLIVIVDFDDLYSITTSNYLLKSKSQESPKLIVESRSLFRLLAMVVIIQQRLSL